MGRSERRGSWLELLDSLLFRGTLFRLAFHAVENSQLSPEAGGYEVEPAEKETENSIPKAGPGREQKSLAVFAWLGENRACVTEGVLSMDSSCTLASEEALLDQVSANCGLEKSPLTHRPITFEYLQFLHGR
uniref:Uncharacterized protein n=1 Tax=Cryptomonas curvata TaxID=233186 RepID=A0A7S0MI20_9CRYP|mmetsp:Transcript_42450/g.88786  ORF Transcript_42450/g.88786 Transcript_42450/m.88786 type:complete len:132 (+) Transcript_42450:685-1080(+)